MNSSAYVCTLEFIFTKSAQASRISKIGLPVAFYSYKLNFKILEALELGGVVALEAVAL